MHKAMEVNEKIMHESANMLEKHGYSESYFHALSQALDNIKDIAKRHGCSETKIKSSLFRSRNKLWEEVKEII